MSRFLFVFCSVPLLHCGAGDYEQFDLESNPNSLQAICPGNAAPGSDEGNTAFDVTLQDCDGNDFTIHDMCGARAAWVHTYSDS